MNFLFKIISIFIVSITLIDCGNKENKAVDSSQIVKNQEPDTPNEEPKENEMVTFLTESQINSVGITFGKIEMKNLASTIKANGYIKVPNNNKANATSLYSGVIKSINVMVGDHVKRGQVIATIVNQDFLKIQEEYLTIGSQITFAEQEYKRQKELYENEAGAKKNLQNSESNLKALRTRRASLQKQIQLMGIDPSSLSNASLRSGLTVLAPINGVVSDLMAQIGSFVNVSSPVAEIVDNSSIHLDLQVYEQDLHKVKVGQKIHFTLTNDPSKEYDAQIFQIGDYFESNTKTIPVHATVIGDKRGLIDGMSATGLISIDSKLTAAVPNSAVASSYGNSYIFVVLDEKTKQANDGGNKGGKQKEKLTFFEKVQVDKGVSDVGYTAITPVKELPKDAKIVTKGAYFIDAKLINVGEED
ncbi:MAG: efflux RND transporter periplasmic adaptor subunit [Bergeyella sp.]|nr:efflux RND transporter periplasmic adaptor subunit [Bergeyella sp.]